MNKADLIRIRDDNNGVFTTPKEREIASDILNSHTDAVEILTGVQQTLDGKYYRIPDGQAIIVK